MPVRFAICWNFNPRSPHGERPHKCDKFAIQVCISTHAPRTGSDSPCTGGWKRLCGFQPTLPARGATRVFLALTIPKIDFNPRSPHGERLCCPSFTPKDEQFQPTLPARGATLPYSSSRRFAIHFNPRSPHGERPETGYPFVVSTKDFNPRSPHGERRVKLSSMQIDEEISTHAPRTGSDVLVRPPDGQHEEISTHAPRTGSDAQRIFPVPSRNNFNPRSPHGERPP